MMQSQKTARAALHTAEMIAHRVGLAEGGGPSVPMPKIAAHPAMPTPNAGVDYGSLRLNAPSQANIPVQASAHLDPAILSPKVTPVTTPDKTLDPAWYRAVQADKTAQVPVQLPFARGGHVQPTEAQKHAGNYPKRHEKFHGLDISIENPKGSMRSGKDAGGKKWSCVMPADYGYVKGTEGADGDHIDVFMGPHRESHVVFVINQQHHKTGEFDEHKCMLGYKSEKDAVADYCKAFSDGKGPQRIKSIETISLDAFKKWLKHGKLSKSARAKSIVDHALSVVRKHKSKG